jgi:rhodanese-related sulfurtransferase
MTHANPPLEVDCSSVHQQLESGSELLLLDCREADEHALVRIERAKLIPMSELMARVAELDAHRDRPIVVHCHHGGRSLQVAQWLRRQGFSQAQSMAGGIDRWAEEIDPSLPRY